MALIGTVLSLTACFAPSEETISGDGTLDCDDGQVVQSVEVGSSASTERGVVEAALAEWDDSGAELVKFPDSESWAAVLDGRDVAVVVPEVNGDGSWFIGDVSVCDDPDVGPADIDGQLDCVNDERWFEQGSSGPDTPGASTPEEAIRESLKRYQERYGGEIVLVAEELGSVVVEGREQVVASASQVPAGGWAVASVSGCGAINP
jgi:hypothetical protein